MPRQTSLVGVAPALPTAKRCIDVLLSAFLVLILAPVMILVGLVIMGQGGAVLYGHQRVGLHGHDFTVWKFRTMVHGADRKLKQVLANNVQDSIAWDCQRKLRNDPRVTFIGKWLRRTSIDELPQLWNVLRGDMSLVGPRPVPRMELREKYGVTRSAYESVRPGITGLWQVSGRNSLSYSERVALDQLYATSRDGWMDAVILLRTVGTVIRCTGW